MASVKISSIALGLISLSFGLLKFIDPFKAWYSAQIETSGLPPEVYYIGIAGEILTGIVFLLPFMLSTDNRQKRYLIAVASSSMIIIMLAATFVHLVPGVPSDILPLKIKPPVIPLAFMFIAVFNLVKAYKLR